MSSDDNLTYGGRSVWCLKNFGSGPKKIHAGMMEDGLTKLGVMEFEPSKQDSRPFWTFATNGMSERRMPCIEEPHGPPEMRLELMAYSSDRADWIIELLRAMAVYPFQYRTGFVIGHTIPVDSPKPRLWDGYLLASPLLEPEEFNPVAIDIGIGEDWVFFAQVFGLVQKELNFALKRGGPALEERIQKDCSKEELIAVSCLDRKRKSLI
jgi:hypothetical protein